MAQLRAAGCVFAEDEAALIRAASRSTAELTSLVARRVAGEPLEHLLGWVELAGHRYAVGPGVFVPRQRSQVLIRAAVETLRDIPCPVVVELCCGTGALAAAIGRARPDAEVWASDIDAAAVEMARANLPPARVVQGDLFDGLPARLRGRVDAVLANAPYVPTDEIRAMPVEAREHEPRIALDGGRDGLDLHRRLAAAAVIWLAPGGAVILETSARQADGTRAALQANGLSATIRRDADVDGTAAVGRSPWSDVPGGT